MVLYTMNISIVIAMAKYAAARKDIPIPRFAGAAVRGLACAAADGAVCEVLPGLP
jgi:hypothetical protein